MVSLLLVCVSSTSIMIIIIRIVSVERSVAQGLFYVDVVTVFVSSESILRRWEEVTRLEGAYHNEYCCF